MDRNGKKAKATPTGANGQRSDLKAKALETLGRAADAARTAGAAPGATKPRGRPGGRKGSTS